jgi:hypothetical protein
MAFRPITDEPTFRSAVVLGRTSEDRTLEFKAEYRWRRDGASGDIAQAHAEELSRDVAQFANTEGGVLLIGVAEKVVDGRRIAEKISPISDVSGLKQWIEQAIRNYLVPSTFSRSLREILLPEGTVLAVNVPPSVHLVALWNDWKPRSGG